MIALIARLLLEVRAVPKLCWRSALTSNNKRAIKALIKDHQVVEVASTPISSNTWEHDIEVVQQHFEKDAACYILFRLDSQGPTGYHWVLMCYVPDLAKVKEKMIYASTRSNLKQQLGATYFTDEIFGTVPGDFSKKGYEHHITSKKVEAPLTEQEQIKHQEKTSGEIYSGGQSSYVHGVAFPVDEKAIQAMKDLAGGSVNYVQISIDCDKERILLDHTATIGGFGDLAEQISITEPRYHFFAYAHQYEGADTTSFVFLYSCPDGSKNTKSAPVKMRMLYSSSKANVSNLLSAANAQIGAKFEINAADDVTEEQIFEALHPKKAEQTKTFAKPIRPGKGGARLTKKD